MSNTPIATTPVSDRQITRIANDTVKAMAARDNDATGRLQARIAKLDDAARTAVQTRIATLIASFQQVTGIDGAAAQLAEDERRAAALDRLRRTDAARVCTLSLPALLEEIVAAFPQNEAGKSIVPWSGAVITAGWDIDALRTVYVEHGQIALDDQPTDALEQLAADTTATDGATDPELTIIDNRWAELNELDKDDIIRLLLTREFTKERVERYYAEYE